MSILQQFNHRRKQQRSANHLRTLSDHVLADLGLKRDQIDDFVRTHVKQ